MWLEDALALAFAVGFFAFVAVSIVLSRLHLVIHTPRTTPLSAGRFVGIAFLFLPMALIEEFLFRWILIGQLYRVIGVVPAFLLSVIAFVLAHRPNGRLSYVTLLNLSVVSVILGFVFLHWGLWVVAAGHLGWNLAEWGLGYAVSGQKTRQLLPSPSVREVKGEPFGPEGHLAATLILFVVLLALILTHHPIHHFTL